MAAEVRAKVNREFRDKLNERVHSNLIEAGKLGQQLTKSSKSHDVSVSVLFFYIHFSKK